MTHKKKDLPDDLTEYDLTVFGHSHKYEESRRGKTLLLNPGSCGPRRFHQAITMATAEIAEGTIEITRIDIPQKMTGVLPGSGSADLKKQIGTEQIARLYLTHPGVDADGIMTKMGY